MEKAGAAVMNANDGNDSTINPAESSAALFFASMRKEGDI